MQIVPLSVMGYAVLIIPLIWVNHEMQMVLLLLYCYHLMIISLMNVDHRMHHSLLLENNFWLMIDAQQLMENVSMVSPVVHLYYRVPEIREKELLHYI